MTNKTAEIIDYITAIKEALEFISANKKWVLATGADNHITARTMSIVNFGPDIYCQTSKNSCKYGQIQKNPNAALCCNNYQIEAKAVFCGRPMLKKNIEIMINQQ